jgi:nucleotide-binding universal stress UspA family protein
MSALRPFTVLVGVDGSAPAVDAVQFAMTLCAEAGKARLHLCTVLLPVQEEMVLHDTSARPARALGAPFAEAPRLKSMPTQAETLAEVLHGDPAEELVRRAAEVRADLIVLGSRRTGPLRDLLAGSLVLRVLDSAPCAVIITPAPLAS